MIKLVYYGHNRNCKLQWKQHEDPVAVLGWYEKESRQLPDVLCPGLVHPRCPQKHQPPTSKDRGMKKHGRKHHPAPESVCWHYQELWQHVSPTQSHWTGFKSSCRKTNLATHIRWTEIKKKIKNLHVDWQNDLIGANFKNIRLAIADGMHV